MMKIIKYIIRYEFIEQYIAIFNKLFWYKLLSIGLSVLELPYRSQFQLFG